MAPHLRKVAGDCFLNLLSVIFFTSAVAMSDRVCEAQRIWKGRFKDLSSSGEQMIPNSSSSSRMPSTSWSSSSDSGAGSNFKPNSLKALAKFEPDGIE